MTAAVTVENVVMLRLRQTAVMASMTAAETMRRPVCLLLTALGVVLTIMAPLLAAHNFGDARRLARDSGLAFQLLFGLLIAAYSACSVMESERESGTAAAVLSKPVSREAFFLAKFIGVSAVTLLSSFCLGSALLLAERAAVRYVSGQGFVTDFHLAVAGLLCVPLACAFAGLLNFLRGYSFQAAGLQALAVLLVLLIAVCGFFSRDGRWGGYDPQLNWQLVTASAVICMGVLLLTSIALLLAVRLGSAAVIFISLLLLTMGLAGDSFFDTNGILYRLLPNWQNFWTADVLARDGRISTGYLWRAAAYALVYGAGVLAAGMAVFRKAEAV